MSRKVINVSEARQRLPGLIQRVADGSGPITIGRRGQAAAVLLSVHEYEALHARKPSSPNEAWRAIRLEFVGSPLELDTALRDMRADMARSIERGDTHKRRTTKG